MVLEENTRALVGGMAHGELKVTEKILSFRPY